MPTLDEMVTDGGLAAAKHGFMDMKRATVLIDEDDLDDEQEAEEYNGTEGYNEEN